MRTRERILIATALGLVSGLSTAFAFEGTTRPPSDVVSPATPAAPPAGMTPASVNSRIIDVPRPPGSIPRAGGIVPVTVPNATLPRPTAPAPALATPNAAQPPDRAIPPPTAFAAPSIPITPFEAFRSGARALKDGQKEKGLVSLEYAADQGVIAAQWKLGRMYAEGQRVER